MSNARVARGRKTQRLLADYSPFKALYPRARAVEAFTPGRDILETPGLSVEVKATSTDPLLAALRQAVDAANGDLPLVVWRPNGYGEERIGEWVAALRLADAVGLLKAAGYQDERGE